MPEWGHAFAAADAGLVATINHVAALKTGVGMPRILLGRALPDGTTLDAAKADLAAGPARRVTGSAWSRSKPASEQVQTEPSRAGS